MNCVENMQLIYIQILIIKLIVAFKLREKMEIWVNEFI